MVNRQILQSQLQSSQYLQSQLYPQLQSYIQSHDIFPTEIWVGILDFAGSTTRRICTLVDKSFYDIISRYWPGKKTTIMEVGSYFRRFPNLRYTLRQMNFLPVHMYVYQAEIGDHPSTNAVDLESLVKIGSISAIDKFRKSTRTQLRTVAELALKYDKSWIFEHAMLTSKSEFDHNKYIKMCGPRCLAYYIMINLVLEDRIKRIQNRLKQLTPSDIYTCIYEVYHDIRKHKWMATPDSTRETAMQNNAKILTTLMFTADIKTCTLVSREYLGSYGQRMIYKIIRGNSKSTYDKLYEYLQKCYPENIPIPRPVMLAGYYSCSLFVEHVIKSQWKFQREFLNKISWDSNLATWLTCREYIEKNNLGQKYNLRGSDTEVIYWCSKKGYYESANKLISVISSSQRMICFLKIFVWSFFEETLDTMMKFTPFATFINEMFLRAPFEIKKLHHFNPRRNYHYLYIAVILAADKCVNLDELVERKLSPELTEIMTILYNESVLPEKAREIIGQKVNLKKRKCE